jgi:hypothetical protein
MHINYKLYLSEKFNMLLPYEKKGKGASLMEIGQRLLMGEL